MEDFDGDRLSLARRLRRLNRTTLASGADVSAAAITQFERNQSRPTTATAAQLALNLGMPLDFFRRGAVIPRIPTEAAHFRSLRSTPAISRDRALAFAELSAAVVNTFEDYIDFPPNIVPTHLVDGVINPEQIAEIASEVRAALRIGPGPIGHMIRTLEAAGVIVLMLPVDASSHEVDAFSTDTGRRPLVLLSPSKNDRARSRFDAAHELGHLVMHPDVEPGPKMVEDQAQTFASHFLAPDEELREDLPTKLDWEALQAAKRKWRVSLRALAFRAHRLGLWSDATFVRANKRLSAEGNPERGPLGPREQPIAIGRAAELLAGAGYEVAELASISGLPETILQEVIAAGSEQRLVVSGLSVQSANEQWSYNESAAGASRSDASFGL